MKISYLEIPGPLIIKPDIFKDKRGYFMETYHFEKYSKLGLPKFVQDNYSKSIKNTLRGLHYQLNSSQGKLVYVTRGKIFDVLVDIRKDSPYFGKWIGITLSSKNKYQLYIPEGFAHGFCVLSNIAEFHYKCTNFYNPKDERSIIWNDDLINIRWPIRNPIISEKDKLANKLTESELPNYNKD